jgi:hypothetical protein
MTLVNVKVLKDLPLYHQCIWTQWRGQMTPQCGRENSVDLSNPKTLSGPLRAYRTKHKDSEQYEDCTCYLETCC